MTETTEQAKARHARGEFTRDEEYVLNLCNQLRFLKRRGQITFKMLATDVAKRSVRVHQKTKSYVTNTDVVYDAGRDLYDITVYRIDFRDGSDTWGDVVAEKTYTGCFVDQLADLIGKWK